MKMESVCGWLIIIILNIRILLHRVVFMTNRWNFGLVSAGLRQIGAQIKKTRKDKARTAERHRDTCNEGCGASLHQDCEVPPSESDLYGVGRACHDNT